MGEEPYGRQLHRRWTRSSSHLTASSEGAAILQDDGHTVHTVMGWLHGVDAGPVRRSSSCSTVSRHSDQRGIRGLEFGDARENGARHGVVGRGHHAGRRVLDVEGAAAELRRDAARLAEHE